MPVKERNHQQLGRRGSTSSPAMSTAEDRDGERRRRGAMVSSYHVSAAALGRRRISPAPK